MEPAPSALLGIDEKTNKPATTRVRDGASARGLVSELINKDDPRGKRRATVKGCIDGNQPFSEARRRANGGWTANLNFMEGEALMDSSAVPYYAIFNGVENYAETRTAFEPDNPDSENWHGLIARRFHGVLKRWSKFDYNMQQISYHMRLHGIGGAFFDRDGDWKFRSVRTGQILVPEGSESCLDSRIDHFAVRLSYKAHELYDKIRNEAGAKAAGWNIEAVRNRIKFATKGLAGAGSWRASPWELWQEQLKNNDLFTSYTAGDSINCAHLFNIELDSNKVSQFLVTESEIADDQPVSVSSPKEDFLLKKPNHYDGYENVLIPFFQNTGDGTWHSVRGLADKAFKHLSASNLLKCRMLDGAFIEASLVIQATGTKSKDALQLMQIGPVTVVPANAEIKQTKLAGFLDGPITVDRLLSNNLSNNIGSFQRSAGREDGRGEVRTAEEVRSQVTKESTLDQGRMTLFYLTLDKLYSEVFRRLVLSIDEEGKRFRSECEKDGVPMAALKNMEYIRANRSSGYGSPQMRQLTDQQMMPFIAMLPEDGRQNFLEDAVGAIKGADKVRRYVPRQHIPSQDDSIAALENAMIAGGRLPVVAAGQNHVVHLNSHFEDAKTVLEPVQAMIEAGESDASALQEAFGYVQLMAQHGEQHLGALRMDGTRKDMVEMFADELDGLVIFSGKLRGAVIAARREAVLQAEQEQQATALGALEQAQVHKAMTEVEMHRLKTVTGIQDKRTKMINDARLKQIKTRTDIDLKREMAKAA